MTTKSYDAVVVGAGPNGLATAIELARAGASVCVFEANEIVGGGARSAELTLPGFVHDICSAVHPLAAGSPFFSKLPLAKYGLEFVNPPAALAHPFDDGSALLLHHSVDVTAQALGADAATYKRLMGRLVIDWDDLANDLLGPLKFPGSPLKMARFGFYGIRSAKSLTQRNFKDAKIRALFGGLAAHSFLPLNKLTTSAFALVLGTVGHVIGWPIVRGGSQKIADALAAYLRSLGGEIFTGVRVSSLSELPQSRVVLCDITPRQLLQITGGELPPAFRNKLRGYRYGPGVFKIDWALSAPVPWKADKCFQAATVHLGATYEEISASLSAVWRGHHSDRPFVIACQPTLFDSTRAPEGRHTLWAYCHVPNGSTVDMTEPIENQIERFAPGFRERVLARATMSTAKLEEHNANLVGGDINGGVQDWKQLFTRPTIQTYSTPFKSLFICSSSTPPGGGVHGMCGYHAANAALQSLSGTKLE